MSILVFLGYLIIKKLNKPNDENHPAFLFVEEIRVSTQIALLPL